MSTPMSDDQIKEAERLLAKFEDEENIDWDGENGEFPEYYQGLTPINPTIGIVTKPSVFTDTAEAYGKILKKKITVELEDNSDEKESNYSYSNKSLRIDIPAEGTRIIKDEGQLLEWYLKRPIFRLLAKSDDRNRQTVLDKLQNDNVINSDNWRGVSSVLDTVYNLVEYYRCENQQGRIFIGSKQDIDDVYSRVPEKMATNQLETLINTRCGRNDLIPPKFQEDSRFYKNELRKVEGTSAVGTMIATRNIVTRIIQKTKPPEPEKEPEPEPQQQPNPQPQPQPEGQQGQGEGQGQGQGQDNQQPQQQEEQEQEDSSDNNEQEQANSHACKKCGVVESEESGAYEGYTCDNCFEGAAQRKSDSDVGQKLEKQVEKALKGKDTLSLDRYVSSSSSRELKTKTATIDWEKPEQEILDKAHTEGQKQIANVRKIFEKIALEQKEKILKKLQETKVDKFDKPILDNPTTSDKVLVNKLTETFARIKTRRVFHTADSGIRVNVDNYIRKFAGDNKVKLFERHDLDSGLDIAYVIDCSGSMSGVMEDEEGNSDSRIQQAKRLLLTMTEATKNLKNVNNSIFAYGYTNDSASIVKQSDINTLRDYGGTPSHIGLYQAMRYIKKLSNRNRKLIIHITDGGPDDSNLTEFVVNQIKQQGIEIHTILLTYHSNNYSKHYARTYGGKDNFTQISDFSKVRQIVSTTVAKRIFEILA